MSRIIGTIPIFNQSMLSSINLKAQPQISIIEAKNSENPKQERNREIEKKYEDFGSMLIKAVDFCGILEIFMRNKIKNFFSSNTSCICLFK